MSSFFSFVTWSFGYIDMFKPYFVDRLNFRWITSGTTWLVIKIWLVCLKYFPPFINLIAPMICKFDLVFDVDIIHAYYHIILTFLYQNHQSFKTSHSTVFTVLSTYDKIWFVWRHVVGDSKPLHYFFFVFLNWI